jgi:hypothetical protein
MEKVTFVLFVGKAIGSVISLNLFGGINGIRKGNAISAGSKDAYEKHRRKDDMLFLHDE